jgi:hypothetical protein
MKTEIKTLLDDLDFHENIEKPGLFSKKLEETDASGKAGVTAYIDFRRSTERGRRFYTVEGIDGFFDNDLDVDTIPVLEYFKNTRDDILTGTKQMQIEPPCNCKNGKKDDLTLSQNKLFPIMVSPVASIDQAIEIFRLYEEAKSKILNGNDILWIGEDGKPATVGKGRAFIKRSGWRKLARFFGLSCKIISKEKLMNGDGKNYQWMYHVVASHPSGASQDAQGVASSRDKFFTKGGKVEAKEENVMLKAQTIGFNRAISDLLGGGEVSYEEIE